jgi:hypothetical protein
MDSTIVLSLLRYLPLASIDALSLTSIGIHNVVYGRQALGYLGTGLVHHTMRSPKLRAQELHDAIKQDDADMVLSILSYRRTRKDEWKPYEYNEDDYAEHDLAYNTLPSLLLPHLLSIACLYKSRRVFAAVCPLIVPEMNRIDEVCQDAAENISDYMESLCTNVLETCDPDIYEAFFSALALCDRGNDMIWEGVGVDNMCYIGYYSYSHSLNTGDSSAYNVLRAYYGSEVDLGEELEALEHTQWIPLLKHIVDSGKYSKGMIHNAVKYIKSYVMYLEGSKTYDELLTENALRNSRFVANYQEDIENINEL